MTFSKAKYLGLVCSVALDRVLYFSLLYVDILLDNPEDNMWTMLTVGHPVATTLLITTTSPFSFSPLLRALSAFRLAVGSVWIGARHIEPRPYGFSV